MSTFDPNTTRLADVIDAWEAPEGMAELTPAFGPEVHAALVTVADILDSGVDLTRAWLGFVGIHDGQASADLDLVGFSVYLAENVDTVAQVYGMDDLERIMRRRAVLQAQVELAADRVADVEEAVQDRLAWLYDHDPELRAMSAAAQVAMAEHTAAQKRLLRWSEWWLPKVKELARELMSEGGSNLTTTFGAVVKKVVSRLVKAGEDHAKMVAWAKEHGFTAAIHEEFRISKAPKDVIQGLTDEQAEAAGFTVRKASEDIELA